MSDMTEDAPKRDRAPLAIAATGALIALAASPLRHLSADEAYYLCASRARWPIPDHPPLLGVLLSLGELLPSRWTPIELRVRAVSALLAFVTALGVSRLAALGSTEPKRAARVGAILGALGLLPMAGALIATPDAPLTASLVWLLVVVAGARPALRPILAGPLALAATLSKVSAVMITLPIAMDLVRKRETRSTAHTLALGTLAALPFARQSLAVQLDHALGQGPAVSAPVVGAVAAVIALLLGQILLYGPAVLPFAARRVPDPLPRGAWLGAGLLAAAALASAIVSGRPPEPNWLAPVGLMVTARAARALAEPAVSARTTAWVVGSAVAPTALALALWALPRSVLPAGRDPLAKVPPRSASPLTAVPAVAPPRYALPSLVCVYDGHCFEIRMIFGRLDLK
jgi:hypothetical protein